MTKATAATAAADLYNFADTAGVPEEIANAVNAERTSGLNQELYDAVVAVVVGAPKALTIKQVLFVLHKLGTVKVPAETTVRAYLNRAKDNGDIGKPSRQSYWTVESDAGEVEEDTAGEDQTQEPVGEVEEEDDLLAGL